MITILRIVTAACLLWLSGCMAYTVEGDPVCGMGVDSKRTSGTVHGSLWGITWSAPDAEACQDFTGIAKVEYQTNIFFVAASVASLGFYVPQSIEVWCEGPCSEDEVDDDDDILTLDDLEEGGGE